MKHLAIILASVVISTLAPSALEARTPVMCTMQYDPVCGTTQKGVYKTYGNSCTLGAEGGTFQHAGECTPEELAGEPERDPYTPPATCTAWFDGCNSCGRSENGETYCTLKACVGEPAPGYCTAYASATPDTEDAPLPQDTSEESTASSQATTTPSESHPNIFIRAWLSIASWFSGLF